MAIITEKPVIANLHREYDSRLLNETPVTDWPDSSGNASNAVGVNDPVFEVAGWGSNIPSVRTTGSAENYHTWDGSGLIGVYFTLFLVWEATDATTSATLSGPQLIGGQSSGNLSRLKVSIAPTDHATIPGAVLFDFFDLGSGVNDTRSGNNVIEEGKKYIITCRHSATGRIIRVNGEQEGSSTGTSHLASYNTPFIGHSEIHYGVDKRLAWFSVYTGEVTNKEIEDFECYLSGLFGVYVASCLPPDPAIATYAISTQVSTDIELPQSVKAIVKIDTSITTDIVG